MEQRVTVRAVCVVGQLLPAAGRVGVTAIDKKPVEGPVQVRTLGLHGDIQADREHHGGQWQAVYLLSDSDVEQWEADFGGPIPAGFFGENLRLSGIDTSALRVGTVLEVAGGHLRLEITSPRIPCQTFGDHVGQPRWVRRFTEGSRPGAYARVLTPGSVQAGDELRVANEPKHRVTIGKAFSGIDADDARHLLAEFARESLAPSLLRKLDSAITSATDVRPTDFD